MRDADDEGTPTGEGASPARVSALGPTHTVGTSCVGLDVENILDAMRLAGSGGHLSLHLDQLDDIGADAPGLLGLTFDVAAESTINGGHDWLGTYATERLVVGVCSRRLVRSFGPTE